LQNLVLFVALGRDKLYWLLVGSRSPCIGPTCWIFDRIVREKVIKEASDKSSVERIDHVKSLFSNVLDPHLLVPLKLLLILDSKVGVSVSLF